MLQLALEARDQDINEASKWIIMILLGLEFKPLVPTTFSTPKVLSLDVEDMEQVYWYLICPFVLLKRGRIIYDY